MRCCSTTLPQVYRGRKTSIFGRRGRVWQKPLPYARLMSNIYKTLDSNARKLGIILSIFRTESYTRRLGIKFPL